MSRIQNVGNLHVRFTVGYLKRFNTVRTTFHN